MDHELEHRLEARLRRLERSDRHHRRLLVATLVLLGAVSAWAFVGGAAAQGRVVEAERFVLRDAAGVVRAELGVAPGYGETSLNLNNEHGQPLITMGGVGDTAIVSLLDGNQHERLFMRVGPDALGNDRGATITVYDQNNTAIWQAP